MQIIRTRNWRTSTSRVLEKRLPPDEDITANDTSTPSPPTIAGPITRAHAHLLNHQVSSLLSSCSSYLDCGDPCTLVLLRNHGEDRKGKGFTQAGFGLQHNTNLWRTPRSHTDSDWGVQILPGTIIKSVFIWIRTRVHIYFEAAAIFSLLPRGFLSRVLHHLILVHWAVYHVGSITNAS